MPRAIRLRFRCERVTCSRGVVPRGGTASKGISPKGARARRGEEGFTLIELIIVVAIMPLIIGTLALALTSVLKLQSRTSSQIQASADGQVMSTLFANDIQNAGTVVTPTVPATPTTPQCGPGTQLLGMESSDSSSFVSYSMIPGGTTLERLKCPVVALTNQVDSSQAAVTIVSSNVSSTVVQFCNVAKPASCEPIPQGITPLPFNGYPTVTLTISETPPPTSLASNYTFNLSATPAVWNPTTLGVATGGSPAPPLVVLNNPTTYRSSQCPNSTLSLGSGSTLSVGSGNAPLQTYASCDYSITTESGANLSASGILTADPNFKSYVGASPESSPVPAPTASDPLAAILSPPLPPVSSGIVTCTLASPGQTTTCPQGTYDTSLSFGNGTNVVFGTANGPDSAYIFDQPVTISSNAVVVFYGGNYWFKGGLYIDATSNGGDGGDGDGGVRGSSNVTFNKGTYLFGDANSGIYGENGDEGDGGGDGGSSCATSDCLGIGSGATVSAPSGALFYIQAGGATLDGTSTSLVGLDAYGANSYDGVSLWDASASGTDNPLTIKTDVSTSTTIGGIYVPNGETIFDSNTSRSSTSASASFLVTNTATVTSNPLTVKIG